jgi:hypothetical protein
MLGPVKNKYSSPALWPAPALSGLPFYAIWRMVKLYTSVYEVVVALLSCECACLARMLTTTKVMERAGVVAHAQHRADCARDEAKQGCVATLLVGCCGWLAQSMLRHRVRVFSPSVPMNQCSVVRPT